MTVKLHAPLEGTERQRTYHGVVQAVDGHDDDDAVVRVREEVSARDVEIPIAQMRWAHLRDALSPQVDHMQERARN